MVDTSYEAGRSNNALDRQQAGYGAALFDRRLSTDSAQQCVVAIVTIPCKSIISLHTLQEEIYDMMRRKQALFSSLQQAVTHAVSQPSKYIFLPGDKEP
jgi:hypothetical protein